MEIIKIIPNCGLKIKINVKIKINAKIFILLIFLKQVININNKETKEKSRRTVLENKIKLGINNIKIIKTKLGLNELIKILNEIRNRSKLITIGKLTCIIDKELIYRLQTIYLAKLTSYKSELKFLKRNSSDEE